MHTPDHYKSQRQVLINGINAFEPVVMQLHSAYKHEEFCDWPTIILATTVQTSAISLLKLLPFEKRRETLDKRSIASIIRNIIDSPRRLGSADQRCDVGRTQLTSRHSRTVSRQADCKDTIQNKRCASW